MQITPSEMSLVSSMDVVSCLYTTDAILSSIWSLWDIQVISCNLVSQWMCSIMLWPSLFPSWTLMTCSAIHLPLVARLKLYVLFRTISLATSHPWPLYCPLNVDDIHVVPHVAGTAQRQSKLHVCKRCLTQNCDCTISVLLLQRAKRCTNVICLLGVLE